MAVLKLSILSPERRLLEDSPVDEVLLTGSEGQIEILPGHAPMVGTLETGMFRYRAAGQDHVGVIASGFFEVRDDRVSVLAESLDLRGEIDVELAKQHQREAEEALKAADLTDHTFKEVQVKLERSIILQQIAEKGHV